MNEAKALKYFNMCDTDGGGDIDLDEFKSALFAVDPNSGNTTGFQPSVLLTPQDAFELFDVSSRKGLERENGTEQNDDPSGEADFRSNIRRTGGVGLWQNTANLSGGGWCRCGFHRCGLCSSIGFRFFCSVRFVQ